MLVSLSFAIAAPLYILMHARMLAYTLPVIDIQPETARAVISIIRPAHCAIPAAERARGKAVSLSEDALFCEFIAPARTDGSGGFHLASLLGIELVR